MAPPRAGALIGGRYRLKTPLAAGGMGAVWLASHVDLETEVAIKLVSRASAKRADLLERFRREARSAAQLKTPHVVQILDYGVDDGAPYIAMELLAGEDLEAVLERESVLAPSRVLEVVRPICKALSVAHAAGIVHRDLKPSNVFIARLADDEEIVKIVDFGIAKELKRDAEYATGSQVLGSPLFMSPEQVAKSGAVDARTDLWSLSVLVHLALFGVPPFDGDGIAELLVNITTARLTPPSARSPDLAPLDAFFAKGLARRPDDRFANVAELSSAFEAAVAALPCPDVPLRHVAPGGAPTVVEDVSWPPAVEAVSAEIDAVATLALGASASPAPVEGVGFDLDATRIARTGASTELSFASSPHTSSPPATHATPSSAAPPRPIARAAKETSARSPFAMILTLAVLGAVGAAAALVVTSNDDARAPTAGRPEPPDDGDTNSTPDAPSLPSSTSSAPLAPPGSASPGPEPGAEPDVEHPAGPAAEPSTLASAPAPPAADPPRPESPRRASPAAPTGSAGAQAPPRTPSPPSTAARPSQPATIDPEWGVPVQRP